MEIWEAVRIVHLLAMAFFVGGQLVMAVAIAPVLQGTPEVKEVAKRFGMYSGIALVLALLTGMYMASEFDRWDDWELQAKLGVLVLLIVVTGAGHMKDASNKIIQGIMLALTLLLVVLGVLLAH